MGSGAPRGEDKTVQPRELTPQVHSALQQALARLDSVNPAFKSAREEEKESQLAKKWSATVREIDHHLQVVAATMLGTHQLSLDTGSDGGGRAAMPWLEETQHAIDRLYFKLDDDEVVATVGEVELLRGPVSRMSYEWVEEAVVNWVLTAVDEKTGRR